MFRLLRGFFFSLDYVVKVRNTKTKYEKDEKMWNLIRVFSDLGIYSKNFYLSLKNLKVGDVYDACYCYFV